MRSLLGPYKGHVCLFYHISSSIFLKIWTFWQRSQAGPQKSTMLFKLLGCYSGQVNCIRDLLRLFIQCFRFHLFEIALVVNEPLCRSTRTFPCDIHHLELHLGHVMAILGSHFYYFDLCFNLLQMFQTFPEMSCKTNITSM